MGQHRVVVAILLHRGRLLLCHRAPSREWYPNVWDFPGGHIEDVETAENALRREVLEEVGVDIGVPIDPPALHVTDAVGGVDLTTWVVRSWEGDVSNRQLDEHDEIGWFSVDEMNGLTFAHPSYAAVLHDLVL